ncbi:MAG: SpoIID/LytB domain-containing protein [Clostridia bacterium]|nr:SpoIID/LytB domain-containing protein [Clostridia bacterium]
MKKLVSFIIIISTVLSFNISTYAIDGERDIRVGLNYDTTALANITLKSDGLIQIGELQCYNKVNANYNAEDKVLEIFDAEGNIIIKAEENEPCLLVAEGGNFEVGDRKYRKSIELTATPSGIRVVNVLPLDHYLYGVLPNEIYPSWGEEALKTTAVASRSFTLASMGGKHEDDGFDICTNTHCQMYRGMGTEYASTNKAIDDTAGQVLTYNNKVISAVYSANNGGYCESSANVWVADLPYYKIKKDPYTPEDLWTVNYTGDEIRERIKSKGKDIGKITGIKVTKTSESGRVTELTITGTNGKYVTTKDSIRSLLSLKSTMFEILVNGNSLESLISAIIAMENSADKGTILSEIVFPAYDIKVTINGKGYGHGVGISQWGCKNMADMGKSYTEILDFYYDGAEIKKLGEF